MRLLEYLSTVFAGHGYDVGGSSGGGSGGGGTDDGGIGLFWIVAATGLAVVAVGLVFWLNPSRGSKRLRSLAPKALVAALIAVPLIAWSASSGGEEPDLIVERWTADDGTPELLVSLGDVSLNTLQTTNGHKAVRMECVGRDGQLVLDVEQRWPLRMNEPGYDYPHTHHVATREQVQAADRCRLQGTRVPLEADVEGALAP
jgi:hypothetical protein